MEFLTLAIIMHVKFFDFIGVQIKTVNSFPRRRRERQYQVKSLEGLTSNDIAIGVENIWLTNGFSLNKTFTYMCREHFKTNRSATCHYNN